MPVRLNRRFLCQLKSLNQELALVRPQAWSASLVLHRRAARAAPIARDDLLAEVWHKKSRRPFYVIDIYFAASKQILMIVMSDNMNLVDGRKPFFLTEV